MAVEIRLTVKPVSSRILVLLSIPVAYIYLAMKSWVTITP